MKLTEAIINELLLLATSIYCVLRQMNLALVYLNRSTLCKMLSEK